MPGNAGQSPAAARVSNWRPWLIAAAASFFFLCIDLHWFRLNDTRYFRYDWRHLPSAGLYLACLALSVPFFVGQAIFQKRNRVALPLLLVAFSSFALMVASAMFQKTPPSLSRVSDIVQINVDGGYFAYAVLAKASGFGVHRLLEHYPQLLLTFRGHTNTKPPGPILFYFAMITVLGSNTFTALVAGMIIGLIAVCSIPATYLFILRFTRDRRAAFLAASFIALCPGFVLFFPEFDQCYPLFAIALIGLWATALEKDRLGCSLAAGLFYGFIAMFTYLPAVLVVFLAGWWLLSFKQLSRNGRARPFLHILAGAVAFALFYAVLRLALGFNFIATFKSAAHMQHVFLGAPTSYRPRRWPGTIPWDFYDFALGSGWFSYLLVAMALARLSRSRAETAESRFVLLALIQIVVVGVSGVIAAETSRTWIFLLPLLVAPIGYELTHWTPRQRSVVYLALLLMTLVINQSMIVLM